MVVMMVVTVVVAVVVATVVMMLLTMAVVVVTVLMMLLTITVVTLTVTSGAGSCSSNGSHMKVFGLVVAQSSKLRDGNRIAKRLPSTHHP